MRYGIAIVTFLAALSLPHAESLPGSTSDPAWIGSIRDDVDSREYEISWQERTVLPDLDRAWQAPNRAHGFRTYFTSAGIRVIPRTEEAPSWQWGLSWVGYGRSGESRTVPAAMLDARDNRVDYQRGALEESFENSPRGLKHGFVLPFPPEEMPEGELVRGTLRNGDAADLVHLDLALSGNLSAVISEDRQAVDFVTPGGNRAIHYANLKVTDARSSEVPAWMEGFVENGARGIRVVLDASDAVYPLTIDPLATSPAWTATGDQEDAGFASSVATAGDVNGDGYSDVIVGVPGYDNGQAEEGRAYLYLGSASGLSATPAWTAEGNQDAAGFGISLATAGDVNGDGYSDVIVGAHAYDNGQVDEGRAFVYLGSASGLATTAAWTAESDQASAQLGYSVATAGDVNGDGYSDVIVGAIYFDNGQTDEGRAFVYLGSASGLATTPAWTGESDQPSAQFGYSVATAGDVNGDGYSDVIVGAVYFDNLQIDEGRAYVYLGSASGLATTIAWMAESDQAGSSFGNSVATAGDVNGDGYSDVIVGAVNFDNGQTDEGRAFVYLGSASGLATTAAWTAEGNQLFAGFSNSVATAGDINGDGYAEVIVGAPLYGLGSQERGKAFL